MEGCQVKLRIGTMGANLLLYISSVKITAIFPFPVWLHQHKPQVVLTDSVPGSELSKHNHACLFLAFMIDQNLEVLASRELM